MIVAAHQPSYLPWLGYLAKLAARLTAEGVDVTMAVVAYDPPVSALEQVRPAGINLT